MDPRTITECETNQSRLKSLFAAVVQFNWVAANDVDDILHQYQEYAESIIQDHRELFTSFSPCASRLDTLMLDTMSRNDTYSKLWKVVKMLLVLSHGQATAERGFSMNKQVETENLYEESVVAKRTIRDYVSYAGGLGGIQNVDVTNKNLILAATAARQKVQQFA